AGPAEVDQLDAVVADRRRDVGRRLRTPAVGDADGDATLRETAGERHHHFVDATAERLHDVHDAQRRRRGTGDGMWWFAPCRRPPPRRGCQGHDGAIVTRKRPSLSTAW